jgi:hypothetical protein
MLNRKLTENNYMSIFRKPKQKYSKHSFISKMIDSWGKYTPEHEQNIQALLTAPNNVQVQNLNTEINNIRMATANITNDTIPNLVPLTLPQQDPDLFNKLVVNYKPPPMPAAFNGVNFPEIKPNLFTNLTNNFKLPKKSTVITGLNPPNLEPNFFTNLTNNYKPPAIPPPPGPLPMDTNVKTNYTELRKQVKKTQEIIVDVTHLRKKPNGHQLLKGGGENTDEKTDPFWTPPFNVNDYNNPNTNNNRRPPPPPGMAATTTTQTFNQIDAFNTALQQNINTINTQQEIIDALDEENDHIMNMMSSNAISNTNMTIDQQNRYKKASELFKNLRLEQRKGVDLLMQLIGSGYDITSINESLVQPMFQNNIEREKYMAEFAIMEEKLKEKHLGMVSAENRYNQELMNNQKLMETLKNLQTEAQGKNMKLNDTSKNLQQLSDELGTSNQRLQNAIQDIGNKQISIQRLNES